MLTTNDRVLYHQLHPGKLFTDISTAIVALGLLWLHELKYALLIMWIPSIIVSWYMVNNVDLTEYAYSKKGALMKRRMTRTVEGLRFVGLFIAAAGAWWHIRFFILSGASLIIGCWWYVFEIIGPKGVHG